MILIIYLHIGSKSNRITFVPNIDAVLLNMEINAYIVSAVSTRIEAIY